MDEYHRLEAAVLGVLSGGGEIRLEDVAHAASVPVQSAYYGASLLAEKGLASIREVEGKREVLTPRGEEALERGLPEELLMEAVCDSGGLEVKRALEILDKELAGVALGQAKAQGLVSIERGNIIPTPRGEAVARDRPLQRDLRRVREGGKAEHTEELSKRGLVEATSFTERYIELTPGGIEAAVQATADDRIVDLEPEMIKNGSWRKRGFRPFDVSAPAPPLHGARKQPYRRFLDGIRAKLVSLGFVEMTGPLVELAFWNFDALFQAQNHPAREVHDTFMIRKPRHGSLPDRQMVERVKLTHENGWKTGSRGWGYEWSEEEASRLVGRTQGTALSVRTLAAGIDPPAKHFSIARVFRPDVLDRTHLVEFNQCEGIIADRGLNFRHLLGILRMFALEIAEEENFAFVPSYYPFTEPSVDLVGYSEAQGGWVELGGAGIFRQEVTQPLGVEIPVIAWGMGIDRLAMFSLGIDDIRELFSQNLEWLRSSRMVI
jgi:phenylalanyl-tRNA synthetase alpha chain